MPTAAELLDLDGLGQRASTVRFDVLDQTLAVIGTIAADANQPARVANDTNATIKRTLSGLQLNASVQADLDPFADRLRPMWVLENGAEYPLGVFIVGGIDRHRWEWGLDADVSGVDQLLILDQPLERGVGYPAGAAIYDALVQQFSAAGFAGPQADGAPQYVIDPSITGLLANPISWPAGQSKHTNVVNDLAALGGAYSAYFDNAGIGRVTRVPDIASTIPTLIYDVGGRIYDGSMVESDDILEAPNRYIVIDSGSPESSVVGYYDLPDDAPNSRANRGFVIARVIPEQGLGSSNEAAARAQAAWAQSTGDFQWVQFSGPPDPRHDTFDAVLYLGVTFREQGWSLPLVEGSEMTHDLRRVWKHGGAELPTGPISSPPPSPPPALSDLFSDIFTDVE